MGGLKNRLEPWLMYKGGRFMVLFSYFMRLFWRKSQKVPTLNAYSVNIFRVSYENYFDALVIDGTYFDKIFSLKLPDKDKFQTIQKRFCQTWKDLSFKLITNITQFASFRIRCTL